MIDKVAYIALGTNLGDKRRNLNKALQFISFIRNTIITKVSSIYRTSAEGMRNQPNFLNAVIEVRTAMSSKTFLKTLLKTEKQMSRKRRLGWEPRIIDLDILLYNNEVIRSRDLVIPHPRMHKRRFVLEPLSEIAPNLVHPVLKKQMKVLLNKTL
jgi:2-amino-4-hydroxy-6-hydroxymethyldihydropteridine diphosphokinase